jgi:MoxR-like ATPase
MNAITTTPSNEALEFEPLFDLRGGMQIPASAGETLAQPDSRRGLVYRMPPELHLAVEVALTTGRPLLLRGEPGTGKSSLAPYVARRLGWRYYEYVVTSATMASDLLWRFDAVRRLADAQAQKVKPESEYVEPGVLWWALDRQAAVSQAALAGTVEPDRATNEARDPHRAIVLIDEIDKAHPDVPNGLLVALGSNQITVPYLASPITIDANRKGAAPLSIPKKVEVSPIQIVITTNEERELPAAFVRRCVTYALDHPGPKDLVEIARAQFDRPKEPFKAADAKLALAIAKRLETLRSEAPAGSHRPSTAEFLDAFRACRIRKVVPKADDPRWQLIERITLAKPGIGSLV